MQKVVASVTALPTATLLISVLCIILSSDNGESSKPADGSPLSTTLYFPDHRLCFIFLNAEDLSGLGMVPSFESRKLWRALQNTNTVSTSRYLWSESHCREKLLPVLGVDATQKSLSEDQGHILEGSDLRKPEELLEVSSFHLHHCKALIQTKLSGTSGSRQGSLITYSLFLKTPLQGNGHYITIPQKKIFTPRNLKMALFNNNVC
ncbi:hypothetical protein LTLLF_136800 [Microtus ochrogaster]|uniref:Aftiphilin clathrin-binding box domain-containing protein n=1 Tax=Microtus ochrogaster TaxID=79684 RepID=A0A8J6GPG2_MICOH|nr:hypothetical protein LTLLF_136800 [Microtus ochrogaster]